MGGREAIRGFAVQTLICLLDSLEADPGWIAVTIEPDSNNDKVDLLWEYEDGKKKAVQVKSSKNPIGRADITRWCAELKADKGANNYELRLAGPVAIGALSNADFGGVAVPTPTSVIVMDLIEQAITKLDRYLISLNIDTIPLTIRTSLIDICAAKLIFGSTTGTRVKRAEFNGWLLHWITTAYPDALNNRLSANCEILWGSIDFISPVIGEKAFQLSTPLNIYNVGRGVAVVEWLIINVRTKSRRMLYRASGLIQDGKVRPFSEFAVAPGQVEERTILYLPVDKNGFEVDTWPLDDHELELIAKFSADDTPRVIKRSVVKISGDYMALLSRDSGVITVGISSLDAYLNAL